VTTTRPLTLVLLAVLGGGLGWLLQTALAATGQPVFPMPYTLALALAAVAVIVVSLALPVRQVARGKTQQRIDPLYATRVVLLAKASSLSGALLTGFGVGVLAYLLTRPVPTVGSVGQAGATVIGAVLLLAGGLLAEQMCRVPPEDEDEDDDDDGRPVSVRP
jgi:apolipoprotein N-acyltransferase